MDKLVERQPVPRGPLAAAPALAVQFFLIPLSVVAVTAAIYVGFRSLLADDRTAQDYLIEIRTGGDNRRWPAAYELSRRMADPKVRAADKTLVPGLIQALDDSFDSETQLNAIWALGSLKEQSAVPRLEQMYESQDAGIRKMVVYALGAIPQASTSRVLETAINDPA